MDIAMNENLIWNFLSIFTSKRTILHLSYKNICTLNEKSHLKFPVFPQTEIKLGCIGLALFTSKFRLFLTHLRKKVNVILRVYFTYMLYSSTQFRLFSYPQCITSKREKNVNWSLTRDAEICKMLTIKKFRKSLVTFFRAVGNSVRMILSIRKIHECP